MAPVHPKLTGSDSRVARGSVQNRLGLVRTSSSSQRLSSGARLWGLGGSGCESVEFYGGFLGVVSVRLELRIKRPSK